MLELYHWEPNGSFLKPMIALKEKGLDFVSYYVDVPSLEQYMDSALKPDLETSLNQEGEGPILVHDGAQITESLFMIEYLEDAFPQATSLRAADTHLQAQILIWARFINEVFMPGVVTLGCKKYLVPSLRKRNMANLTSLLEKISMDYLRDGWSTAIKDSYSEDVIEEARRKVAVGIARIESALANAKWLVGTSFSLADIDAFSMCNALPTLVPDIVNEKSSPRTLDWIHRIRDRPGVQAALQMSKTGKPEEAFAPGPEHARWG